MSNILKLTELQILVKLIDFEDISKSEKGTVHLHFLNDEYFADDDL